jgi:hypothetical protein
MPKALTEVSAFETKGQSQSIDFWMTCELPPGPAFAAGATPTTASTDTNTAATIRLNTVHLLPEKQGFRFS